MFEASTTGMDARTAKNNLAGEVRPKLSGLWLGIVEDCFDPIGLQRIRVRVLPVHKMPLDNPTESIHWALRMEQYGGFFGGGSWYPLPVGSKVWVMFMNDDPNTPVIVGANHSIPAEPQVYGQQNPSLYHIDQTDASCGPWKGQEVDLEFEDGSKMTRGFPTAPEEVHSSFVHEPTVVVPFKTPKGASLVIEERDEIESLELLDRSGQGLRMSSPIQKKYNKHNGYSRRLRSVFRGDQLNYSDHTVNRESELSLRDLAQQGITIEARKEEERAIFSSRSMGSTTPREFNYPDEASNTQVIDLSAGANRTLLLGIVNGSPRFSIAMDANRGIIDIESDLAVRIKSKKVIVSAHQIVLRGDVTVDGSLTVAKDLILAGEVVEGDVARDKPINYR